MTYYRLIFTKDENGIGHSEIIEQEVDEQSFNSMNWEKPIIRHFDGKHYHFVSLHRDYLECMLLGIAVYTEMSTTSL